MKCVYIWHLKSSTEDKIKLVDYLISELNDVGYPTKTIEEIRKKDAELDYVFT